MLVSRKELDDLLRSQNAQPHAVLGMHPITHNGQRGVVVRALVQDAKSCEVVDGVSNPEKRYPMEKLDGAGFFETFILDCAEVFRYRLRVK